MTASVLKLFAAARSEVLITSPYFIPGEPGLAMMRAGTAQGGRIRLLTNSLGATDEPLVYWEYTRYREDMLKAGVTIYEIGAASSGSNTTPPATKPCTPTSRAATGCRA